MGKRNSRVTPWGARLGIITGAVMSQLTVLGPNATLIGLAAHILPVALLVGLGILIGRSLSGRKGTDSDIRYRAQETIDSCRTRAQDLYRDIRNHSQDVLDVDGKVIR